MLKLYAQKIITCIKAIRDNYQIFITILLLFILLRFIGIYKYSLADWIRHLSINSGNAKFNSLLAELIIKLIVSILVSLIAYITVSYFAYTKLHGKRMWKKIYKILFTALWPDYIVIAVVVLLPLQLIVDTVALKPLDLIINALYDKTKMLKFIGYMYIFFFEILKNTVFFYVLEVISMRYMVKRSEGSINRNRGFKEKFTGIAVMLITLVLAAGPISYCLNSLEHSLFLGNNVRKFVDYISVVFKTCYIVFIIMYIAINVLQMPQRKDYIRRNV